MPARLYSRHTFTRIHTDDEGARFSSERVPFRFRELADNRIVVASGGDTLFSLAGKMFVPLPRPAGLWWVIGDFQPTPIHDPTIQLGAGQTIVVPSVRVVQELILGQTRRNESVLNV